MTGASQVLAALAAIAFVVTLLSAGPPWYRYGSDAFTGTRNGWNTCSAMQGTHSFVVRFWAVAGVELSIALLAHRIRRWKWISFGVVAAIGVFGSFMTLKQLDGYFIGEMCSGYDFEVLRSARTATFAMTIVEVAIAAATLTCALRPMNKKS